MTEKEKSKVEKALDQLRLEINFSKDKVEDLRKEIKEEPLKYWHKTPNHEIRDYQADIREAQAISTLLKERQRRDNFSIHVWAAYNEWFDENITPVYGGGLPDPSDTHQGYPHDAEGQRWDG